MIRAEDPKFLFLTIIGEQSKNDRKEHPQPQRPEEIHTSNSHWHALGPESCKSEHSQQLCGT